MIQGVFIQGTTPKLNFNLPVSTQEVQNLRAIFTQKKEVVLIKEDEEFIDNNNNTFTIPLTQEETFLFKEDKGIITGRLKILMKNGEVFATKEFQLQVKDSLDKELLY